jgi:integrase
MRDPISRLRALDVGCGSRTLANYKSAAKAALHWFENPRYGKPGRRTAASDPLWTSLFAPVTDPHRRRLANFVRYCSDRDIAPTAVSESVLDAYFQHRNEVLDHKIMPNAERRRLVHAWNACAETIPAWPQIALAVPNNACLTGPDWSAFPEGLQQEIAAYLESRSTTHRTADGKRVRPAKASSLRTRRAELLAFARRAVAVGVPIESLTSLSALLDPDVVERVLDDRWVQDGDKPATYTVDLSVRLYAIARQIGCLSPEALERLRELRARLEEQRPSGMTDKNTALIRTIYGSDIWPKVVKLPVQLLEEARDLRARAPVLAALQAQLAVAIGILTFAPVRIGNLVRTRLDQNLIRPDGPGTRYWLTFPEHDVKNRVKLEHPLSPILTPIIDEYLTLHRSALLRGAGGPWLFPGETGHKGAPLLSDQIIHRIETHTGLRVTPHQMRHAAVALIYKSKPGDLATARLLLGHKRADTTANSTACSKPSTPRSALGPIVHETLTTPEPQESES